MNYMICEPQIIALRATENQWFCEVRPVHMHELLGMCVVNIRHLVNNWYLLLWIVISYIISTLWTLVIYFVNNFFMTY